MQYTQYIVYNLREIAENFKTAGNFKGTILLNEKMAPHTTFRVGGPAPLFIEPADTSSLITALSVFREQRIPYFILGGGSNIVVSDAGFDGAVVSMNSLKEIVRSDMGCVPVLEDSVFLKCGAGLSVASLVNYCTGNHFTGMEPFAGLPGTIGGAVYMNARCFDLSISDVFASAEYIDTGTLEIRKYVFNKDDWDYKKSPFQTGGKIIVAAVLKCVKAEESAAIAVRCAHFIEERRAKGHFKYPSAGSVFKNNHAFGKPSGVIIDEAGLKGKQIGGAQIAPWHGNFIININNASESDIRALVDYTISTVKEKTGFILEPEIIFCGK